MPTPDELTALDATFLELEQADDSVLMHIGGAMVFDARPGQGPPTIAEVRDHLDQRLDLLPRYRQKLSDARTGGLSWPSWERDPHFAVDAHVRHAVLPAPGDESDMLEWLADFYSHRLDRSRPLWELVLLDGLTEGRWALVSKIHHCLVDGVGSVDLVGLLLGAEPVAGEAPGPQPTDGKDSGGTSHGWLASPPAAAESLVGVGLAAARGSMQALAHPREAVASWRGAVDLLVRDELIPAPPSSLNVRIGSTRRLATVHVGLEDLRAVRSGLGGTVNDVVLCAVTGALRRLLQSRGDDLPARGLRAMVPVNIRVATDHGELGNKVSSLFVDLPVAEADPLRRYRRVVAATEEGKASGAARAASLLTGVTELVPPLLHAVLARSMYAKRLFNITITNVPGSPVPVDAFGAPMIDVVPIVPLAADHSLGIAVVSYAGQMTFGLSADRAAVPDLDVLRDGIVSSLLDLSLLAHAPRPTAH
jgi:WS/DGAT/MGAT family acyltransferase